MADREEKLNAAKELLKRFQESKRTSEERTVGLPLTNGEVHAPAMDGNNPFANYFGGGSQGGQDSVFLPDPTPVRNEVMTALTPAAAAVEAVNHQFEAPAPIDPTPVFVESEPHINATVTSDQGADDVAHLQQRITELEGQVSAQKATLHQYEAQILSTTTQLQDTQSKLDAEKDSSEEKHNAEVARLTSDLESHKETINLIVGEKRDLEKSLQKLEALLNGKEAQLMQLSQKLDEASKQSPTDLEAVEKSKLQVTEISSLKAMLADMQATIDDKDLDIREMKAKLQARDEENNKLKVDLAQKTSKLEMAELNLNQMRSGSSSADLHVQELKEKEQRIAELTTKNEELMKREQELAAYIQQTSHDREQIIQQYTAYSKQLTEQIEATSAKLNDKIQQVDSLTTREAGLVAHIEQLETQLQKSMQQSQQQQQTKESNSDLERELEAERNQMQVLRKSLAEMDSRISELVAERNDLQGSCQQRDHEVHQMKMVLAEKVSAIDELETQLEMLKSSKPSDMSSGDLVAALESDKVAASRAMTQNKQLKEQLVELETAVINLTNSKAELASELDTLRRWKSGLSDSEEGHKMEMVALQDAVKERDRTIQHLKEQMKYYTAFAENSLNMQSEDEIKEEMDSMEAQLAEAKEQIRCLNSLNSELRNQIEVLSSPSREASGCSPRGTTPAMSNVTSEEDVGGSPDREDDEDEATLSGTTSRASSQASSAHPVAAMNNNQKNQENRNLAVPVMTHDVAFVKLEQKFFDAMNRIADLLAEKEQLEHLTIQLQEETETVGEYITLYQYQRQQIKKKMAEKETQLQMVSMEREELRSKVSELQSLVKRYLSGGSSPKESSGSVENGHHAPSTNGDASLSEINPSPSKTPSSPGNVGSHETAGKILALISEIGANQMLKNDEHFNPWFWDQESGRLMTV